MQENQPTALKHLDLHQAEQTQPKYERLKEYLLADLTAGRLKPGDAMPSEQYLADTLRIARNTVRQALGELEQDGLIRRVPGKGTFVDKDAHRRLRRGLDTFALVTPHTRIGFFPSLLHGFETASKSLHHQTVVYSTQNNGNTQANVLMQLIDSEVGGVAIVPATNPATPAYQIRLLRKHGIPLVFCGHRVAGIKAPLLAIHFEEVGRRAGRELLERGHRRVAYFSNRRNEVTAASRAGLREILAAAGSKLSEEFVFDGGEIIPGSAEQERAVLEDLKQMWRQPEPPTGIMTSFDNLAELIYLLLGQLGLRVPEDVSLISFGGSWRAGAIARRLTSIVVDEVELGRRAVELLHEMRTGQRPLDDNEEFVMPLELSQGMTLRKK